MATYKTNIGACQNDTVTTGYLTNIGADQTDAGPVGPTYVDAECTVTCTSSLVITAEVLEIIDATITITCTSTITISIAWSTWPPPERVPSVSPLPMTSALRIGMDRGHSA